MTLIRANGWDFDCEIVGEGPDLVFVHGEIHGTEYWEHQIAEFARDHRCLIYNRRGHSRTGAPGSGYSLENQRRDLEALIAHFGISRPVMIAVAFGTTIVADFAIRHPDNIRGIVMVAWSELHEAKLYLDRWVKASETVAHILRTEGRQALVDYLHREGGRSIYMVIPHDSPIRDKCVRMFANHPLEEYERGMLEFAQSVPDLIEPFSALDVPVLGVCGHLDPFPDRPELLSGMENFRESPPIAGASRFVQWEKPAAFNEIVRRFLSELA